MRRIPILPLLVFSGLTLAGCASAPSEEPSPPPPDEPVAVATCTAWALDITNNSVRSLEIRDYLGEELVDPAMLTYPSWPKGYRHWIGDVPPRGRKSWQLSGARPAVLIWPWVVASPDEQRWAGGPNAAGAVVLRKLVTLKSTCTSN